MAENATTDSGRIVKMEVDYSSTCDEKIPECQKLAKEGNIHDALDTLLALEKQTRTVSSLFGVYLGMCNQRICTYNAQTCLI
jgi:26S proteasome regulatory subunit N5